MRIRRMGKCYRHLTIQDRIRLYELLFSGAPIIEIAEEGTGRILLPEIAIEGVALIT